jgi:hypothetical protein
MRNGFCEPAATRRIGFAGTPEFERIHEDTHQAFGCD